ncbi:MAG TPA: type II secretion system F family protein [Syntrophales bacterium]|nr:type II secretion system F family protein [Syntrophales bacterium]
MNELAWIALLIFTGLIFLILAMYMQMMKTRKKKAIIDRVEQYAAVESNLKEEPGRTESAEGNLFARLAGKLAPLSKPKTEEELGYRRRKLSMAGYRKPGHLVVFYGAKVILAVLLPVLMVMGQVAFEIFESKTALAVAIVMCAVGGFYLPDLLVRFAIRSRQEKIRLGFPDALDLMVVCVEAGMGLDQTIKRIADEMKLSNDVISDEFNLMNLEMRAGRARQEAMHNLAARTGVEDVRSLVTLLVQTEKFGTSIAQALRVHSDSMRTKRRQKAEEMAIKLPVKMLFPLILFIFPALFVVIVGPAAIKIYRVIVQTSFGGG